MIAPADDIDRLMSVMERGFDPAYGEAWNRRQVEDALLTGHCRYFNLSPSGRKACNGEPAIGFYLSRQILEDIELLLLAVDPEHRRRGFGRILLEELKSESLKLGATRIFLEMRRGNPAEHLYRKFGFAPVGERPNYYRMSDGTRIDAITLAVDLGPDN